MESIRPPDVRVGKSTADLHSRDASATTVAGTSARSSRRRLYLVLSPLLLLLILWVYLFYAEGAFKGGPSGKAFGADYTMFLSASQLLQNGGDPYNPTALLRTETALMHRLHRATIKPLQRSQVRVGNPPLLYWAMRPLLRLDYVPAALISLLVLYGLAAVGFLCSLRYFDWRSRVVPTVLFLLMPQVVLGAFYGNVIGIVFAAIGVALVLSRRYPALAGAVMCFAWLKPPVALPIVVIVGLFCNQSRSRYFTGFFLATAGATVATLLTCGLGSMGLWAHGLLRYSNDMAIQPDVISLAGLYVHWMPTAPRLILEALTLAAGLGATLAVWTRRRGEAEADWVAPLWILWILASPYGHFFDEILLAVPVVAFLGRDGCRTASGPQATVLYLLFFSLFFISWAPHGVYLLPIPLVVVGFLVLRDRRASNVAFV